MSKEIRVSIDNAFGFDAVLINSALVSAQNRQRLYWVGKRNDDGTYSKVDIEQPDDRGILLRDILETGVALREKQYTLDANYYKDGNLSNLNKQVGSRFAAAKPLFTTKDGKCHAITANYVHIQAYPGDYAAHSIEKKVKPLVAEPVCMRYERTEEAKACRKAYEAHEIKHGYHELHELHPREDGKTNTLSTVLKDNPICEPVKVGTVDKPVYEVKDGLITIKGKQYPIKLKDGFYIIRKLTVRECMRLQTVPEWYDFSCISNSQAYKCLGNGWTVDVIAHILSCINK